MQFALNDWENVSAETEGDTIKAFEEWKKNSQELFEELKKQIDLLTQSAPPPLQKRFG